MFHGQIHLLLFEGIMMSELNDIHILLSLQMHPHRDTHKSMGLLNRHLTENQNCCLKGLGVNYDKLLKISF